MDRVIVQPGALPQDTDILNTNLFGMVDAGYVNEAVIGAPTAVSGLACTPTSPASLQVNIAVGSIFQTDEIDATAYGSLGINATNITKQGILPAPVTLTITPPTTSGFSQVYLVEASLEDIDAGSLVLSYFNSANPSQPFSGPNNSGSSNFTQRTCRCVIQLKAGTPATTGTQVAPSVDVGWVGLYTITVGNGASTIVSGNIAQLPSAPFFPTLPQVPFKVQQGTFVYAGQDTGTANAYIITFVAGQPVPASYVAGMEVKFKALNACTGASVVNVNGLGNVNIRRGNGVALSANDIVSGGMVTLTYDGTNFQMSNYLGTGTNTNTITLASIPYVADTGAQNALIATYSPAITSGQQVAGLALEVKLANTITGACTINVNGLGLKNLVTGDLQNPPNALYVAGEVLLIIFDGTQYQVANSTSLIYRKPAANTTIFVNGATGSDTSFDGTSSTVTGVGTAGPFATIQKGLTTAFGFAPSQFTITVQVAAGTYSEGTGVTTPLQGGPAVIINASGAGSTFVTSSGSTFVCQGPNTLTVQNLSGGNTAGLNNGVFVANQGGNLTTNNTASSAVLGSVFSALSGGTCNPGNHTFNGGARSFFAAAFGSTVNVGAFTYTFSGAVSVTATVIANAGGIVAGGNPNPSTFVNPSFVNGQKFQAQVNGVVFVNGLSVNYYPGNVAGTTSSGGQYG